MQIIYARPKAKGWNVITVLARLAARLLEAELVEVPAARTLSSLHKLTAALPRRRGSEDLLIIAPEPVDLQNILHANHWMHGYRTSAAWVIDSWWADRIPHVARQGRHFDLLYVTERENMDVWTETTRTAVRLLPQGTDALAWGSANSNREFDLMRVGRQPTAWDDDEQTRAACRNRQLRFAKPPTLSEDPEASLRGLMGAAALTRFTLAFSNLHSPAKYTHPSLEYLTGRWTDSLAAGAVVAGIPPKSATASELLWPEATLTISASDLASGLDDIRSAALQWSPAIASINHLRALERLDWRWRIAQIADDLGWHTATLDAELELLQRRIAELHAVAKYT